MVGIETQRCHKCGKRAKIRSGIAANGTRQFFWWCDACGCMTPTATFLKHSIVENVAGHWKVDLEDIPVLYDNSEYLECEVCGAIGAELHHWAPQCKADEFGPDWVNWPVCYLCRDCHHKWHRIVTPGWF